MQRAHSNVAVWTTGGSELLKTDEALTALPENYLEKNGAIVCLVEQKMGLSAALPLRTVILGAAMQ